MTPFNHLPRRLAQQGADPMVYLEDGGVGLPQKQLGMRYIKLYYINIYY